MKIVIITENQKEILLNNDKDALAFDKEFGTNISQQYKFPFGLSDDMIWSIYYKCKSHKFVKMGDDFTGVNRLRKTQNEYCDIWKKLVNSLSYKHFPYPNVDSLPFEKKEDILCGMASNFNMDDIVSYAIKEIYGMRNTEIKKDIFLTFPKHIQSKLQWVVSRPTFEKIKNHLKNGKLKMIDYV